MRDRLYYVLCLLYRWCFNRPGFWRMRPYIRKVTKEAFRRSFITTTKLLDGQKMRVDLQDFGGQYLFMHGFYELGVTRVFKDTLRPGDNVIDIGANLGYFSLLAARLVQPGQVFSFEASPLIFSKLKENIGLNRVSNIAARNTAVADREGELEFFQALNSHLGISSLRNLKHETDARFPVPCLTINSLIDEIPQVRLIKIDIEGAEYMALCGMTKLLERDHPLIVFELTDSFLQELGSSAAEVTGFLRSHGYSLKRIEYNRLTALTDTPLEQVNVLAEPDGG